MDPELPGRLPLFPLGTVLFPGGTLPLQIFEVRYLDMIGRCRRDQLPFGVVSLMEGSEVQKAGAGNPPPEVLAPLGTLARIIDFANPIAGLMQITCLGGERFRIVHSERLPHGLWVADISRVAPDSPAGIPEDLAFVADKLGALIRALQARVTDADSMPVKPPFELEDAGWVANRWAELLPVPSAVKQSLLALDSPLLRLELIGDILGRVSLEF